MAKQWLRGEHRKLLSNKTVLMIYLVCVIIMTWLLAGPVLAAGDPQNGRDLFTGAKRLENGGAACIACHNVQGEGSLGGGAVGKDLTKAYARFGDAALTGILQKPAFPIMKDIYESRPLTEAEQQDLKAFFQEVSKQPGDDPATATTAGGVGTVNSTFLVVGLAGFIVLLVLYQIFWSGRHRGVRRQLVGGATR